MLSRHSSGVYQPSAGRAATEHMNNFLMSVLRPWLGAIAPVPDGRLRGTILKTTHSNTTITSANTNIYLILADFASPRRYLRLYAWDSVTSEFYYLNAIEQDEDLSQNFKQLRLVSAGLRIKSSTVTGNTFTVSGNINGITFYDLPDLAYVTHENLVSYKRNNSGAVAGVPVADGGVALAMPDADHVFDIPRVQNVTLNAKQILTLNEVQVFPSTAFPNAGGTQVFFSKRAGSGGTGLLVPPNAWGAIRGQVIVAMNVTVAPLTDAQVSIVVYRNNYSSNPASYALLKTPRVLGILTFVINGGFTGGFQDTLNFVSDYEEEMGEFYIELATTVAFTGQVSCNATVDYWDVYRDNMQGPGAIFTIKGLNAGQQITVDAIYNYEVVPNAELARNLPTEFPGSIASVELEVAHTVLAKAAKLGIRFILPASEYDQLQAQGFYDAISAAENAEAHAASFGSMVAKIARFLKPVARSGLLAGIEAATLGATPYLGPMAMPVGALAAGAVNKAFANGEGGDRMPYGSQGYASSENLQVHSGAGDNQNIPVQVPCTPEGPSSVDEVLSDVLASDSKHSSSSSQATDNGTAECFWSEPGSPLDYNAHQEVWGLPWDPPLDVAPGAQGHASSLPFVPSLAEVVASMNRPSAQALPVSIVPPSSHVAISEYQFDRDRSPLTEHILTLARTGKSEGLEAYFQKLGRIGFRAKCVITVTGESGAPRALTPMDLYVTDAPVQRSDPKDPPANYRAIEVQGLGTVMVDSLLQTPFTDLRPLASLAPGLLVLMGAAKRQVHVTLSMTRGLTSVAGASWHAAFYAACCLVPYGAVWTGSMESRATDLSAKVSGALAARPSSQLIILNPAEVELGALVDEAKRLGLGIRVNNPLGAPGIYPAAFATGDLPAALAYAFVALAGAQNPVEAAEKEANKAKNLREAQILNPNMLLPRQSVMIGGKPVDIDISALDVDSYLSKPMAAEAVRRTSPGATVEDIARKWKQMMSAKPPMWGSLARKYASVESARLSLVGSGQPGEVKPPGKGNPANAKRRAKEKLKRDKRYEALGLPPPAAAKPAAAPSVPEVEMGGPSKKRAGEAIERPEI